MSRAIGIVGLPGSGKTHLAESLKKALLEQGQVRIVIVNDPTSLLEIPPATTTNLLIITDPHFCLTQVRVVAKNRLIEMGYRQVDWIFFENNGAKCLTNVRHRADGREVTGLIKQYASLYEIDPGAECLVIWQPTSLTDEK